MALPHPPPAGLLPVLRLVPRQSPCTPWPQSRYASQGSGSSCRLSPQTSPHFPPAASRGRANPPITPQIRCQGHFDSSGGTVRGDDASARCWGLRVLHMFRAPSCCADLCCRERSSPHLQSRLCCPSMCSPRALGSGSRSPGACSLRPGWRQEARSALRTPLSLPPQRSSTVPTWGSAPPSVAQTCSYSHRAGNTPPCIPGLRSGDTQSRV